MASTSGSVRLSDDGSMADFVRGSGQNRVGWVANPSHDPDGGERAVWAAKTDGSGAWRLAVISNTEVGRRRRTWRRRSGAVARRQVRRVPADGQLYRARTARGAAAAMDTAGVPFIKEWGRQSNAQWSPDGSKLAFVSTRENHAFIGLYDMKTRKVDFVAPSTDIDGSPVWSPDGKRIAFIRRPGTPFGQQVANGAAFGQTAAPAPGGAAAPGGRGGRGGAAGAARWRGGGGEVSPQAAARREWMSRGPGWRRGGGGGGGRGAAPDTTPVHIDGLCRAAFPGGYTLEFMVADIATGKAQQFWHNQPNDRVFNAINSIAWAGDTSCSARPSRTTSGIATTR